MPSSPPPLTRPLFALPNPHTFESASERRPRARGELPSAAHRVVIVGASPALLERCHQAAATLGAVVVGADLGSLTHRCRSRPPAAIVVTEDVYAFDPRGFVALAREVGARLIQLSDDRVPREALLAALRLALATRP